MIGDKPSFRKYGRILHLGEVPKILNGLVEVYEKIDGGNAQIRKIKGRVMCGSKANFLTREEFFRQEWFKDFNRWALGNYSFYNLPENLIVYGEWSSKHTLDYRQEFTDRFFLLDVFDLDMNEFIPYTQATKALSKLGINDVIYLRPLFIGRTDVDRLEKMIEKSDYRDGDKEGLVIKNYNTQQFSKLWTSTVRKKGVVTQVDVNNIFLSLEDAEEGVTRYELVRELESNLIKSGRDVSAEEVREAVDKFYLKRFSPMLIK